MTPGPGIEPGTHWWKASALKFRNLQNMCLTEVCVKQAAPTNDGHLVYTDTLKTFALIVSAHPYYARKYTLQVIHRAPMIGQMAIAIALPGFNGLDVRWPLSYFSFNGSFSLPIFYFQRKNEENLSIRSLNILQNAVSSSF